MRFSLAEDEREERSRFAKCADYLMRHLETGRGSSCARTDAGQKPGAPRTPGLVISITIEDEAHELSNILHHVISNMGSFF